MELESKRYDSIRDRVYFCHSDNNAQGQKHVIKIAFDLHGTLIKSNRIKRPDGTKTNNDPTIIPFLEDFLKNLEKNINALACLIPNVMLELAILSNGYDEKIFNELDTVKLLKDENNHDGYFAKGNIFSAGEATNKNVTDEKDKTYRHVKISKKKTVSCNKAKSYGLAARLFKNERHNKDIERIIFLYIAAAKHDSFIHDSSDESTLSSIDEDDKEKKFIDYIIKNFSKIIGKKRKKCKKEIKNTLSYKRTLKGRTNYTCKDHAPKDTVEIITFNSLKKIKDQDILQIEAKELYIDLTDQINDSLSSAAKKHGQLFKPSTLTFSNEDIEVENKKRQREEEQSPTIKKSRLCP